MSGEEGRARRFAVVASMRNEGPFIVEWVTWYRLLGFTDILVVTNDCTDRSPQLLQALQTAGWVTHLHQDVPPGQPIVATKLALAHRHPVVQQADWVLVCDADEFLVIHAGAGRIGDLIGPAPDFLGMSINWKVFGTSGRRTWEDGLVHRQFRRAGPVWSPASRWVKSIHRRPDLFRALGEHGPKGFVARRAGAPWGQAGLRWVNSVGLDVPQWVPGGPYQRTLPPDLTSHVIAQMNHYMLRSDEDFSLRRGTLSPAGGKDRYDDRYFATADRNEERDDSALRHAAAFDALYAEAMALPDVARLHHLCCADHVAAICAKAGRDPADDPRFARHMAAAAES